MKHVVGVADMRIAGNEGDVIITHALGSCLGITIHDPVSHVGGMLHVMLPTGSIDPARAAANPFMFVDSGVPQFFREAYAAGAVKDRLIVKVAGGASVGIAGTEDRFAIGRRNYITLKKLFWQNGVLIRAEAVGGHIPRTMSLELGEGRVWISTAGQDTEL
jgi:chemotaxis protein CheD